MKTGKLNNLELTVEAHEENRHNKAEGGGIEDLSERTPLLLSLVKLSMALLCT